MTLESDSVVEFTLNLSRAGSSTNVALSLIETVVRVVSLSEGGGIFKRPVVGGFLSVCMAFLVSMGVG